jgi:hypothetical protein
MDALDCCVITRTHLWLLPKGYTEGPPNVSWYTQVITVTLLIRSDTYHYSDPLGLNVACQCSYILRSGFSRSSAPHRKPLRQVDVCLLNTLIFSRLLCWYAYGRAPHHTVVIRTFFTISRPQFQSRFYLIFCQPRTWSTCFLFPIKLLFGWLVGPL